MVCSFSFRGVVCLLYISVWYCTYLLQTATAQSVIVDARVTSKEETSSLGVESGKGRLRRSVAGQPIASIVCDPFLSESAYQRTLALLKQPNFETWNGLVLEQIAQILPAETPLKVMVLLSDDAEVQASSPILDSVATPTGTHGTRLTAILDALNLYYVIGDGCIRIFDEGWRSPVQQRLYDITPLSSDVASATRLVLIIMNSIDGNWERDGGDEVIFILPFDDYPTPRTLLLISATSSTHLSVQSLLDALSLAIASGDGEPLNSIRSKSHEPQMRLLDVRQRQPGF